MKHKLLWLCIAVASPLCAQNFTAVTASHIQDASGALLPSGQFCVQAITGNTPFIFQAGGGGIVQTTPACATVANGVLSSLSVANSNLTTPANVTYVITVTDNATGNVVIQTAPTQISGYSWDFDSYVPTSTPLAIVQPGPTGPAGPAGGSSGGNSVINCGATGGGTADDTAAINSCLASSAGTGLPVWFPNGTYKVTSLTFTGSVTLIINGIVKPSANMTIPSSVTVDFQGGQIIPGSGATVTFSGGPVRWIRGQQIFNGPGTITGLSEVQPEMFGSANLNDTVVNALGSAGGIIDLPNTYLSSLTAFTTPGTTCINKNNVWLKGNQQPQVDSLTAPTKLQNGSVVQGGVTFCGAYRVKVTDLGFDVGSNYAGTSTTDALDINGTSGGSNLSDPIVDSPYVENVTTLLSSGGVAFHGILVEHANNVRVLKTDTWLGVHGTVFKSTHVQAAHLRSHGNQSEGLDIKTDAYTTTGNLIIDDFYGESLTSSAFLNNCVALDAEANVPLANVTLSNATCDNSAVGLNFLTNSTTPTNGYISQVQVSNFNYSFTQSGLGFAVGTCLNSTGTGANTITAVQITGIACAGNAGAGNMFPASIGVPLNFSVIAGMKALSASPSQISGSNLDLYNWNSSNTVSDHPFHIVNNSLVNLAGIDYVEPNLDVVDAGSTLNVLGFGYVSGNLTVPGIIYGPAGAGASIRGGAGTTYDLIVQNNAGTQNDLLVDESGNGTFHGAVTGQQGFVNIGNTTWKAGSGAPSGSCVASSLYSNFAATSASTSLYVCYPANTWNAVTVP
jgi:hypothetical protein